MDQKIVTTIGIILGLLILTESWFLVNMDPSVAYLPVVLILVIIFVFIVFFLLKIKGLEKTEIGFVSTLDKLKEDYIKEQDEKNKISAVIDNLSDGVLILDKDNNIDTVNHQAEKILDIQAKQILNKPVSELERFPNTNYIVSLLSSDIKDSLKEEVEANRNFMVEIFIKPLIIEKKYVGKFVILHDIAKRKITEKIKADFVSLTIHQLSTPLATTKLSLEMLLGGSFGKINKEQKDIIEKTYQRNKMLIYLVNDLLNVDQIQEGGYSYNWTSVDIEELIELVISSNEKEIKRKKIKIEIEKPEIKTPKMTLDKEKMFIAIQNIFDNAVKYTLTGGKITISFSANKKEFEFKIQDSGIGIPEHQKEKLFTKFFRGSNAIKMELLGSGLGLFITKNIIEAHSGKIWFESKENQGTTFFFTIPIKEAGALPQEQIF